MKEHSKRNIGQRALAVSLAALMTVAATNTDAYSNLARSIFGTNESSSITAHAADTTVYDCGSMTLKGSTSSGTVLTSGWDASDISSTKSSGTTLADALAIDGASSKIVCYSQYLGGLQGADGNVSEVSDGIYDSKDVTDYKAPAAPSAGIRYYYISKGTSVRNNNGTAADLTDDYNDVDWTVYTWPVVNGGTAVTYTTDAAAEAELDKIAADESLTDSGSEVKDSISDRTKLTSAFGKARPEWKSGNVKYSDWFDQSKLTDGTADVSGLSVIDNGLASGKNLAWKSSTPVSASTYRPWLSMTLTYDGTATKAENVSGMTVAEFPLAKAFPANTNTRYLYALGTTGLATLGDSASPIAMSKTSDHTTTMSMSYSEGNGTVNQSPITLMNTLWSNSVHFNAAGYTRDTGDTVILPNYKYFETATDNTGVGLDATGLNPSVKYGETAVATSSIYAIGDTVNTEYYTNYSDIELASAKSQITANYTEGNSVPTGARLYAIWAEGLKGATSVYSKLFDWSTAISSLKSTSDSENFDELLTNGATTVNVCPVFDVTYDYQRAAGTVTAKVPISNPTIDTSAVDKTTSSHVGTVSETAGIVDTVTYQDVTVGDQYQLDGQLYVVDSDGNASEIDGATAQTKFKATETTGSADVNFTYDNTAYTGQKVVVYEKLIDLTTNGVVAKHEDATDADQTVTTSGIDTVALGEDTNDHTIPASATTNIIDTVTYTGVTVGDTYKLVSRVYDASTKKVVSGIKSVTTTFTPKAASGSVDVTIAVSASDYVGKSLVVYETLTDTTTSKTVAKHEDITDKDQTVTVAAPSITTVATDSTTGKKTIGCTSSAVINDAVTYKNLEPSTSYSLTATLYNKSTGTALDSKTVTKAFKTGSSSSGTTNVSIPVDTTEFAGKSIVVFEELTLSGDIVADHEDLDDDNQTVTVSTPTIDTVATGDATDDHTLPWAASAVINDKVSYDGLTKGQVYTLVTDVYDKDANKSVLGAKTSQTTTFTPDSASGSTTVSVTVDSSKLMGKSLVVFETLKAGNSAIVTHRDLSDDDQTVTVASPTIKTVALDAATGTHMMQVIKDVATSDSSKASNAQQAIKDTVYYSGLADGTSYTLVSAVHDKATGLQVAGIDPVTTSFTAVGFSGSVAISIPVTTSAYPNKTFVVFETLSLASSSSSAKTSDSAVVTGSSNMTIKHEDINDINQTVCIGSIGTSFTTGDKVSKNIGASRNASAVDTISFTGLQPGRTYTITGQVMNYDVITGKKGVSDSNASSNTANDAGYTKDEADNKGINDDSADSESVSVQANKNANSGSSSSTTKISNNDSNSSSSSSSSSNDSNTTKSTNTSSSSTKSTYVYGTNTATTVATTTIVFTPTAAVGTVDVPFTIDTSNLQNHSLVAYETITDTATGVVAMSHQDINDSDQTITVGTSSHSNYKTGVESHTMMFFVITLIALAGAAIAAFFAFRKKKKA